jgi:tRNA A37 N6-isopentenylltransferase MiaA
MDKTTITEAVNHLIEAPNYAKLINEMTGIIERWDTHPMAYGGTLSKLNSLIDVGLENRDAFEKLLDLVERKRKLAPQTRRTDYQRELMRDRRARMAKALELTELTNGPMNTAQRRKREQELQSRWSEARARFIAEKGELTWNERNAASREFWAQIDATLDSNLRSARRSRTPERVN